MLGFCFVILFAKLIKSGYNNKNGEDMKFFKLSISYMFKNFLYLFLFSLIPAVFIGAILNPFKPVVFLVNYSSTPVINFGTILSGVFNFSWLNLLLGVIGFLITVVCVSAIFGQMENHMRSGKLNIKSTKNYVNNSILMVAVNLLILLVLWFVVLFVVSLLFFLFHLIFSGINNSPTVINTIIAIVLAVAGFLAYIFAFLIITINIPNMLFNGYPLKDSISNSIKMVNNEIYSLILSSIFPVIVIVPIISFTANTWALPFMNILGMLILIMFFTSQTMTSYFEITQTKRYDNRKYYNYK